MFPRPDLKSLSPDELKEAKEKQEDLIRARVEIEAERDRLKKLMQQVDREFYSIERKLIENSKKTTFEIRLDSPPFIMRCNERDKAIVNAITTILERFKSKFGVEYVEGVYDLLKNEVHMKFAKYASRDRDIEGKAAMDYLKAFPNRQWDEKGPASHLGSKVVTFSTDKLSPIIEGLNKLRDLSEKEQKAHKNAIGFAKC